MFYARPAVRTFGVLVAAIALGACGDSTDPTQLNADAPSFASSGPVLVECPVDHEISTTGNLGITGGSIRLENHELAVPSLTLTLPTEFALAAPVSSYMEIAVHATDSPDGFTFSKPATITIDYSRCSRSNIDKAPLTVWHVDPQTKALLENMGGVDDKVNRTITFETDHLSHFSIAQ